MKNKNVIKILLDIAMAILFVTFFDINLISFKFHVIGGYVFGAMILAHMFLNRKWIINISKRLFDKKLKPKLKISYIVSLLAFIDVALIIASGVFMMKSPNHDSLMFWKNTHYKSAYLSIVLIGIHVALYWKFVINMCRKLFKRNKKNKLSA